MKSFAHFLPQPLHHRVLLAGPAAFNREGSQPVLRAIVALAKAARDIESCGDEIAIASAGTALESALHALGLPTRPLLLISGKWASSSEILAALLQVDGGGVCHHANPSNYATGLLEWFVLAAETAGNRWPEGERELVSRAGKLSPTLPHT